jgi:uncharacterized protein YndB with AHSA1/START domain
VKTVTFERVIAAPVEQVWAVITDIERYVERFIGTDAVEMLTEGPFEVGTRWRETRTVYGQSATVENRVTECEPLRRYTSEARVGARATTEFVFTPRAEGRQTSVRVSFQTTGGSIAYRLVEFLNRRRMHECVVENNMQDLADLARACEQ